MGIPAGIPGRVGLIYLRKRKKSRLKLQDRVFRTPSSFWRNPVNVLIRIFHIAGLAMDAVRKIELHPALSCLLVHFHFVHMGRAESQTGVLEFLGAPVVARFE